VDNKRRRPAGDQQVITPASEHDGRVTGLADEFDAW
jgi:hypothetical protein